MIMLRIKAEYRVITLATCQLIRPQMDDDRVSAPSFPFKLCYDIQATMHFASAPILCEKDKIYRDYHLKEKV